MDPQPITLFGRQVRLEPQALAHAADLFAASQADPSIWRYRTMTAPATLAEMETLIRADLDAQARGAVLVFAQVEQASGKAVGSTSYLNISRRDRGLEIGSTWLGKPWQRSGINTEAKYLLLRHAFETLGAVRVQLKTDRRNVQSQTAIERLGAVREGILRRHMLMADGVFRDSVMYSITDDDWPYVKLRLKALMAAHEQRGTGVVRLTPATSGEPLRRVAELFAEYRDFLRVIHADACSGDFDRELAELPGAYGPPGGLLLLATAGDEAAGCAALRDLGERVCEMKRLYVRPAFRGAGVGRGLATTLILEANRLGYRRMRLDTLPAMAEALPLYRALGFKPIEPYGDPPTPGAVFLELGL